MISIRSFTKLCSIFRPICAIAMGGFLIIGLYYALFASPPDYQQGDAVRIMYVHVPAAWMALGIYCFMAVSHIIGFIWKHPLSHIIAITASPIGAAFALLCLITGSIWGKPMWNTWWVFDARLTSMLILFFFYVGHLLLYRSHTYPEKGEQTAGILAIVGVINVPIVKFSVDWWNTLHQPASIIRSGGIAIAPEMLLPLLLMFGFYVSFFGYLLLTGCLTTYWQRKIERHTLR